MKFDTNDIANAINQTGGNQNRDTRVELEREIDRLKLQQSRLNHYSPEAKMNILKSMNSGNRPSTVMRAACKALSDITGEELFFHQIDVIMSALFNQNDETDDEKVKRLEEQIKRLKAYPAKSTIDLKIIQNAVKGHLEEIERIKGKQ